MFPSPSTNSQKDRERMRGVDVDESTSVRALSLVHLEKRTEEIWINDGTGLEQKHYLLHDAFKGSSALGKLGFQGRQ